MGQIGLVGVARVFCERYAMEDNSVGDATETITMSGKADSDIETECERRRGERLRKDETGRNSVGHGGVTREIDGAQAWRAGEKEGR